MTLPLPILKHGSCEPIKACVHGASLALCGVMAMYNAAAWINRRERHLALNTLVYALGLAWERRLVTRHLEACRGEAERPIPLVVTFPSDESQPRRAA